MIAAGEVVQRPASVVKELMENAVDAGATDIKVVVADAGRTLIQVIDNGCGMTPDDAVLCFERHATSKLASAEDLHHILTFGFRGEALASIVAVAEVTLRTRQEGEELGVEVTMAASENKGTREVSCPVGTNVAVRNLFYNIPARRKFLKSDNVELRHIVEEFQRVALTRPDIAFTLTHNGKDIHVVKPAPSHKFRIQDLLGPAIVGDIVDIEASTSLVSLQGYIGKPESARKTLGNQFFFVNGRYFRSPLLHKAVMKAYENLIPEGYTPSYFIYLDVDPSTVDVNIHPTKAEIKFEEDQILFQTVFAAVKEALGKVGVAGSIEFDNPEAREIPVIGTRFEEYRPSSVPTAGVDLDFNPFEDLGPYAEPKQPKQVDYSSHVDKNQNYGALFEDRTLPTSQILIVQGKYILTQSAGGIMVVNIRRAQERLLHDRFLKALTANAHVSQAALFPVQVPVGVEGRLLIEEHQELLRSLGFDIAPFGNDTVVVSGVPEGYSAQQGEVETLMADVLLILKDENGALPGVMEQSLAQKFAVLGACSARNITSPLEAQRLVDALLQSENPEFTSAGKRILAIMGAEELEKRF
ncbi:MAG: DNA mismatch repair endonuclease MutL [Bacteroidales bacterium]|jgi:DNA mismatch repair protein MutL|nr:DNA mismatch repair endonuclease MutL [Bacteroidales bacterium]